MDLGHLAEQIAKCVTGSLPEIEDSPLPSESEVQPSKEQVRNKEQEVQLSPGDKEQATAGGESSMTELRYEVKRRLLEYDSLEAELDQLTDEYDEQADKIHQLTNGKGLAYNYNDSAAPAKRESSSPSREQKTGSSETGTRG